jgi:hypothetical protein
MEMTMDYMLLIHGDEKAEANQRPANAKGMSADYAAYTDAMKKAGVYKGGERLRPTSDGASIRVTDGKMEVVDGPYAETKEQFGGYYVINVPDLDTALSWAARCPAATRGTVEVRPVWVLN